MPWPQGREPSGNGGSCRGHEGWLGQRKTEGEKGRRRGLVAASLRHKMALLSFTKDLCAGVNVHSTFPSCLLQERLTERQEEGRRVGGVLDISWRPQCGAPLSPGQPGLPEAPERPLSKPGIAGVVLARPLQLGSWALFPSLGRSSE